ncbi:dihydrofolate reductase [Desertihabitans brevis]|uniref:dihydrofolate reductase n=1 Tax=Desertihabitans brevis TaxID=2268447 RepID=UPI001313DAEE|nr:dihydrofolate reductase [Desertihabitans brevis]
MTRVIGVAAYARNRVIGDGPDIPWHLPGEQARFKELTTGGTLVMGRRTYESIGRPLPGRQTVVLTRSGWTPAPGHADRVAVAAGPEQALALAAERPGEVFVVGGGEVYRLLWPWLDELRLTEVQADPAGDVTFPEVDPREWVEVARVPQPGWTELHLRRSRAAIGLDVGGTAVKAVVCREDGTVLARSETATPAGAEGLLDVLAGVVTGLEAQVAGLACVPTVGLSVPGIVDDDRQVAVHSTNLGWRDARLADDLARRLGRPAVLGHDVRAGGRAELRWGAAAGESSVMFVAVGTGIATALYLDGRAVVSGGYAGETGHALVPDPATGELELMERISSAAAIARRWSARSGRPATGSLDVFTAADAGDPDARAVITEALETLADVLAVQMSLVGPVPVVLGGGLSRAGEAVLGPLTEGLRRRLVLSGPPPLRAAQLGSWAGAMGSADAALARHGASSVAVSGSGPTAPEPAHAPTEPEETP